MIHAGDRVFALISDLSARGEDFCVATIVRTEHATSAKAGAKAIVTREGAVEGFLGGACVHGAVQRAASEALATGEPRLIRVRPREEVATRRDSDGVELYRSSCPSGGTVDLFVEPMRQAPRLIVCGASPVAQALARLAHALSYRVVVVARRGDLNRFQDAATIHEGFDLGALAVVPRDFVVVATQGRGDREALSAALRSEAAYVAFVGSHRKAAVLREKMAASGLPRERLSSLRAPAGLPIGAIDPSEIALSIMAEIVDTRRRTIRDALDAEPVRG